MLRFYGAIFETDSSVRVQLYSGLSQVWNPEIVDFFQFIDSIDLDTFYDKMRISPELNDMNWASFFATGKIKYLDNILEQVPYQENREDMML